MSVSTREPPTAIVVVSKQGGRLRWCGWHLPPDLLFSRWSGVVQRRWLGMLAVAGYARICPERLVEVGMIDGVGGDHSMIMVAPALTSQRQGRRHVGARLLRPSPPAIVETHPTLYGGEVGAVVVDGGGRDVGLDRSVVDGAEGETNPSCVGGGAGLTSLREGRRHAAVCRRCPQAPAIVEIHPTRQL